MKILIDWKGHRIGIDYREVYKIKLTKDKLYLWDYNNIKSEIFIDSIKGFEAI